MRKKLNRYVLMVSTTTATGIRIAMIGIAMRHWSASDKGNGWSLPLSAVTSVFCPPGASHNSDRLLHARDIRLVLKKLRETWLLLFAGLLLASWYCYDVQKNGTGVSALAQ